MLLNFDFLIPYIIFLSFFSFYFHPYIFFSFLFSCFFSSTHVHLPPISIFTLCLTFCFSSYLQNISPLLPLSFVLFLLHTHIQISLPQSHTNKFSFIHAQITGREQRLESSPLIRTCNLITILVRLAFYMVFFFFFLVVLV